MRLRPFLAWTCLALLPSGAADAFVRTKTSTGLDVAWTTPCIEMRLYLGSPAPSLGREQYLRASQAAAAVWSHDALACSDLRLSVVEDTATDAIPGQDNVHMIVFRQDDWCPRGSDSGQVGCYPPNALAITTVWKNKKTGEIPDTDIEINAVKSSGGGGFEWNDLVANPTGRGLDFQNMLTHELGHVIGLAHNCFTATDSQPSTTDYTGAPTMDCYAAGTPASIKEATMFPSVDPSDTSRRSLSPDDELGVCTVYPYSGAECAARPKTGTTSGCALGPGHNRSGAWAFLLSMAMASVALAVGRTAFRRKQARVRRRDKQDI